MEDIKCVLRLRLYKDDIIFGPGIAELLTRVRDGASLSEACKAMDMAYSKAWRILKRAEKGLGYSLTEGRSGGAKGGGTQLTEKGEILLENYLKLEEEINKASEEIFKKYDF